MSKTTNVILITAYTQTLEKIDNLRELVKKIKSLGYQVCLATHTSTPQDIIDRCDYFIYDSKNEVNYNPEIAYWINHVTPTFKINYKQYGSMSTHIVPIFRLVVGALTYLKSLNIDNVCMIEYDTVVHDAKMFELVFTDLHEYTVSSFYSDELQNKDKYLIGVYGIRLQDVDLTLLSTDVEVLLTTYTKYFQQEILPVTERILYDLFWSKYSIILHNINIAKQSLTFQTSDGTNGYGDKSYLFHVHENILHFFCSNNTDNDWKFDIVINNINHEYIVSAKTWRWIPIQEFNGIKNIKLIKNNIFIKEFSMENKNDLDLITKWVIFEQL